MTTYRPKKNNIQKIQNIWEMTIFLAMAQQKILRAPGPTASLLQFCCFKLTDIDTRKKSNITLRKKEAIHNRDTKTKHRQKRY